MRFNLTDNQDKIMEIRNTILYPLLIVAALSVTVFSMVGVATMTGHIPSAHSESADSTAHKVVGANAATNRQLVASCATCGVVESVRVVERKGPATGLGAVAGGLTGAVVGSQIGNGRGRTAMGVLGGVGGAFAGNEIEKNVNKRSAYEIRARMEDGTVRVRTQGEAPEFGVGDKVRYEHGIFVRRG